MRYLLFCFILIGLNRLCLVRVCILILMLNVWKDDFLRVKFSIWIWKFVRRIGWSIIRVILWLKSDCID